MFTDIKKLRKSNPVVASSMDGVKDNVEKHFKDIYKNIYNSIDDKENILNLLLSYK